MGGLLFTPSRRPRVPVRTTERAGQCLSRRIPNFRRRGHTVRHPSQPREALGVPSVPEPGGRRGGSGRNRHGSLVADLSSAVTVFGAWAVATGLIQVFLAVVRLRDRLKGQWPMIISGAGSIFAGSAFLGWTGTPSNALTALAQYSRSARRCMVYPDGPLASCPPSRAIGFGLSRLCQANRNTLVLPPLLEPCGDVEPADSRLPVRGRAAAW